MSYYGTRYKTITEKQFPILNSKENTTKNSPRWYYYDKDQINISQIKNFKNNSAPIHTLNSIIIESNLTSTTENKSIDFTDLKPTISSSATAPSIDPLVKGAMLDLSNLSELGKFPDSLRRLFVSKK